MDRREEDWWALLMLTLLIMYSVSQSSLIMTSYQNYKYAAIAKVVLCSDEVCMLVQACLVQLGPKECLLVSPDHHSDAGRVRQMLSRSGVLITDRKKG